jgi:hypothetical protein
VSQEATVTETRVISADSHVALAHDRVKAHLASRHHAAYDAAVAEHERITAPNRALADRGEHWYRPGHFEGAAHLADMDVDGVAAEVVYCESASTPSWPGCRPTNERSSPAATRRGCGSSDPGADR